MIRAFLIALALAALSVAVRAQTPPASSAAEFAAQVCRLLSTTVTERDALQAQVAAVQKQLDEARAAKPAASDAPHP